MPSVLKLLPELQGSEMAFVQSIINNMTDEQALIFANAYRSRRKSEETFLLAAILGFVCIAGVQRFLKNEIGMGLLFLFTFGLCFIGTIVDLIRYKELAYENNQKVAIELAGNLNLMK
jgi:TM2 domain-containing membrane protein YozV